MATTRINAVSATATTFAGDDFLPIDGNVNATRRLLLTSLFASPSAIGSVTPAAGTFTSLSGTNINGTLGATTPSTVAATTISATGKFTAGSGSYSAGDGSIYVGASTGLTLVGKAGSTYDVFISTAGGQALLTNPTGTANVVIGNGIGTISAANSLAVTGALSSTTGANFATSSGDVGIGTASPAGKLQVTGSSASFILNTAGTEFYNTNAGTVKIYASNAAGALALSAGGRDAGDLFINSSGNVGIGTTSPTAVLHVVPSGTTNITGVLIAGAVDRTGSATAQAVSALKLTTAISPENNASAPGRSIYGLYANLGTMTGVSGAANNTFADIVITPATVSTPGGGNLTNRMGLYIDAAPAGATNNYAIYNTAGTVYLGTGNVGIGTTSPASILHLKKDGSGNGVSTTFEVSSGTKINWLIGCQNNINDGFEITPSTSAGGSTFSTPVVTVTTTGAAITGALSATGQSTFPGFSANKTTANSGRIWVQDAGANSYNEIQSRNYANTADLSLNITSSVGVYINGPLSKASGSFRIEHPLPSKSATHQLVHSFVEAPKCDLIYRGKVDLVDGKASVNIDTVATMTEGTFEVLCGDVQCVTSNESGWGAIRGKVVGNILIIEAQDAASTDNVSWIVIGERKDPHIMETGWTDDNGRPIVEPLKPAEPAAEPALEEK